MVLKTKFNFTYKYIVKFTPLEQILLVYICMYAWMLYFLLTYRKFGTTKIINVQRTRMIESLIIIVYKKKNEPDE